MYRLKSSRLMKSKNKELKCIPRIPTNDADFDDFSVGCNLYNSTIAIFTHFQESQHVLNSILSLPGHFPTLSPFDDQVIGRENFKCHFSGQKLTILIPEKRRSVVFKMKCLVFGVFTNNELLGIHEDVWNWSMDSRLSDDSVLKSILIGLPKSN